jgi:hypothetical protein
VTLKQREMAYKVNDKIYRKRIKALEKFVKRHLPRKALKEFKKQTPIDGGYARRNTKLSVNSKGFKITGDYPYSGVIDRGLYPNPPKEGTGKTKDGYSTQAPKGMVEPTLDFVDDSVRDFVRRKLRR